MSNELFMNVRTERVYEKIVSQIHVLIEDKKLHPGDRLPSERELAISLGCSRSSLREAFRVLESEGLIVSKAGGGRYIQKIDKNLLEYRFSSIDLIEKSAILYFLEAREVLEPKIVELACRRVTEEGIIKLEKAIKLTEENLKTPEKSINSDGDFHLALAEATDNFVFVSMMDTNLNMIRQVRKKTLMSTKRYHESLVEHKAIFEAIKQRNVNLAVEKTLIHLRNLRENVLRNNN